MRKSISAVAVISALAFIVAAPLYPIDRLEQVKKDLAAAGCVTIDFLSILESDIFDRTDTVAGQAVLASDGRYSVQLGTDWYLSDLTYAYAYSPENNQVTIEEISDNPDHAREISFVTRLDEFYESSILKPGMQYRLVRKGENVRSIPDSLVLYLLEDTLRIRQLEYLDINDELNRIVFQSQRIDSVCPDSVFVPAFPDTAEQIRMF